MRVRSIWLPVLPALLIAGGGAALVAWKVREVGRRHAPAHVVERVKDFALTDQTGRRVSLRELRGEPWIAYFFYASCEISCPLLTVRAKELQSELARDRVRIVGFTTDPARDTPKALARFGRRVQARPGKWLLLSGAASPTRELAGASFGLGFSEPRPALSAHASHGELFALVDGQARIRGYYRNDSDREMKRLIADVRLLTGRSSE